MCKYFYLQARFGYCNLSQCKRNLLFIYSQKKSVKVQKKSKIIQRNTFCLEFEFLGVQPCWFAHHIINEAQKRLACEVFDIFATHFGLAYDITHILALLMTSLTFWPCSHHSYILTLFMTSFTHFGLVHITHTFWPCS